MEAFRYRGRVISVAEVEFIRRLIASHPGINRRQLSLKLCEAWQWKQANGTPRDMVCRGLLLGLERAGRLTLPAARHVHRNPPQRRPVNKSETVLEPPDTTRLDVPLGEIRPLEFRQVRRGPEEPLFNHLIAEYHPLGYTRPVGEHLKYLVYAQQRPVACFAWSSAPRHLGARDRFIGWSAEERRRNIALVTYNPRFLIMPWVEVPHLASHLLGRMVHMLPAEWERVYGHPVHFAETFVDTLRFRGTCYRAANWVFLGLTTGRGKDDHTGRPNRSLKTVLGYPLTRDFRRRLRSGA